MEKEKMIKYVLVSQGVEIFRSDDKKEAEIIMHNSNQKFYKYRQKCLDSGKDYVDNEVFMYEEVVQ